METKKNQEGNNSSGLLSEIISLLFIVFIALLIRLLVFEPYFVPTGSMKDTILEGDYVFGTKYNYGYSTYSLPFIDVNLFEGRIFAKQPERGDIIIMKIPSDKNYIKRLIGLPGEKIQIIDNVTYINDQPVDRIEIGPYISESGDKFTKYKETLPNGVSFFSYKADDVKFDLRQDYNNCGPYIVENDNYFFMGDNRDHSGDSRYQLGNVPFKNLIAKGRFFHFSTSKKLWDSKLGFIDQLSRVKDWFFSIRTKRLFKNLYDLDVYNGQ